MDEGSANGRDAGVAASPGAQAGTTGSRARHGMALRIGLAAVLVSVGAVEVIVSIALSGVYPTGISGPYAIAFGVAGGMAIAVALITLQLGSVTRRGQMRSLVVTVALGAGAASLLAFMFLVLGKASIFQDHTLPTAARFVPVGLGSVAALLGVFGIATSRGDVPRILASFAALVMGLGSAIVPLWLWANFCYLFEVDCL